MKRSDYLEELSMEYSITHIILILLKHGTKNLAHDNMDKHYDNWFHALICITYLSAKCNKRGWDKRQYQQVNARTIYLIFFENAITNPFL